MAKNKSDDTLDSFLDNLNPFKKKKSKRVPPKKKEKGGNANLGDDNDPDTYTVNPGDCFYHKESRKLYQVTGLEKGITDSGATILVVVYVGANFVVRKQSYQRFLQNFEKTFTPRYTKKEMKKQQGKVQFALKNDKPLEESPEASDKDTVGADGESLPLGTLFEPTERHELKNMILWPDTVDSIEVGIESIGKRDKIREIWHLDKITDNVKQNIFNFWGASGTGKTMAALCVARKVGRKLFQVDYSQIVDKYVGETAKHIHEAFETAREQNAILFFDEADGLLSKRVDMSVNADYANSVNQNRNVLMQELDKWNDIAIMSTNFFCNYDEAMLRRINRHVEFKLPNCEMREKLYKMHITEPDRAKNVDIHKLSLESKGLSGGDIKNVCINSIDRVSMVENPDEWQLTQTIMENERKKISDSKESHKKGASKNKQKIGFGAERVEDLD